MTSRKIRQSVSPSTDSGSEVEAPAPKCAKRGKKCAKRKGKTPQRKWTSITSFTLTTFDPKTSGIQPSYRLPANSPKSAYFTLLFDGEIASIVCQETNKYADSLISHPTYTKKKELSTWVDTIIGEIYTFIALVILMGLVVKKRIRDYWSTDEALRTPYFNKVMMHKCFFTNHESVSFC